MAARPVFIPGLQFQTVAVQTLVARRGRATPVKRRAVKKRRTVKKRPAAKRRKRSTPARKRRTATKKPARMIKGSAAAKRHMAKLRKMRRS